MPVPLTTMLPNVRWNYSVQDLSSFDYEQPLGLARDHLAGFRPIYAQNLPLSPVIAPELLVISHSKPA
jgi:hypothetical protein